jgi:hypothetical protein
MSERSLLREAGLKENVEVLSHEFLPGANFTRGTLTVFQTGYSELRDAMRQVFFATDIQDVKVVTPPEHPAARVLSRFGMLGGAAIAGMSLDPSSRPSAYAQITLRSGYAIEVKADRVRIDMMLKQWAELRR